MKKRSLRNLSVASAIVFSTATLTGCSVNLSDVVSGAVSQFSGGDVMFAQMMIEHHEQAIEMGKLAATHALNPEVKSLAEQITKEQAPEIQQMKQWLSEAGAPLQMAHEMVMDGMLDSAQMSALTAAAGAKFDELFLKGMIAHHKGAVTMAKMVADSGNAEVAALAKSVIESQTKQIEIMQELLAK